MDIQGGACLYEDEQVQLEGETVTVVGKMAIFRVNKRKRGWPDWSSERQGA